MTESITAKPGFAYFVSAGVFLVWNLIGMALYYQHMTLTPEIMAEQNLTAAQIAWIEATPVWANAAYGLAVTLGVLGAVLLLLRRALALPAFVVSLVAIVVQDIESFVLRDASPVWGNIGYVIPTVVLLVAIVEILFARAAKSRGWLS